MSGALIAFGRCYVCGHHFTFNAETVPSYDPSLDDPSKPEGRQPICEDCIEIVNSKRRERGLPEFHVFADSYGPGSL